MKLFCLTLCFKIQIINKDMATINKNISPKERQANIDALINYLVTSKRETQAEMRHDYAHNPEKRKLIEDLKQKNAASRANKRI
jgi:hypothetical protein